MNEQRNQYRERGYLIARNVVRPGLISAAQAHVRQTIADHPGVSAEKLHHIPLYRDDPFYLELVSQPGMLAIAQSLLGPDLALFATGYIIKEPGNSPAVLWHQDGAYWPLEPMEVCTLWLAITESTPANGCMRVVPGTHNMDLQALNRRSDVRNLLSSSMDENLVDESAAVDLVLAPGDVSVHHPNVVHGSSANPAGSSWRYNLVARVIAAGTKVTDPEWPGVFHLCGQPREDVNRYLELPASCLA